MQIITSKDNEVIKNIRKLKEKKYRDLNNEYIVEGIKMIREAGYDIGSGIRRIIQNDYCPLK